MVALQNTVNFGFLFTCATMSSLECNYYGNGCNQCDKLFMFQGWYEEHYTRGMVECWRALGGRSDWDLSFFIKQTYYKLTFLKNPNHFPSCRVNTIHTIPENILVS